MTVSLEVLEEARHHIRSRLNKSKKPGSRTHIGAMIIMNAEINALTHPCCSKCTNIDIHKKFLDGKEIVVLDCKAHLSPTDLWRNWFPGDDIVTCEKFIPVEDEIFSHQD